MKTARITLKNYRAFSDEQPAQLEISDGITALVGRNNSGKSALLLSIYELRPLFEMLRTLPPNSQGLRETFIRGWRFGCGPLGTSDPHEILHNANERPTSIEIEVLGAESIMANSNCLYKIIATCERSNPGSWSFQTFGKTEPSVNLSVHTNAPGSIGNHGLAVGELGLDCSDFLAVVDELSRAKYYGPFRNAINQGAGDHFDLKVGTAFVSLWNAWKTSGIKAQTRAIGNVTDDIRRLFEFDRLEINASTSLNTLVLSVDGQPYRLGELGAGLAQFIMCLGNAATSPPSLMLIDEPETNLHPSLQIDFILALAQYARTGVVFASHSIGLARSVGKVYSVQKSQGKSVVRPFEATLNYLEFVGELSFSTFKDMGSDRILLVEGVEDVIVAQQLLRLVGKEHTTVILPLGGDQLAAGGREIELSELKRLSNNVVVLVDSERESLDGPPSARRQRFLSVCQKLKFVTCITDRRAIENYFPPHAVKAALGDRYDALTPYQLLRECARPWSKSNNWKIARHMTAGDLDETDIGLFLRAL